MKKCWKHQFLFIFHNAELHIFPCYGLCFRLIKCHSHYLELIVKYAATSHMYISYLLSFLAQHPRCMLRHLDFNGLIVSAAHPHHSHIPALLCRIISIAINSMCVHLCNRWMGLANDELHICNGKFNRIHSNAQFHSRRRVCVWMHHTRKQQQFIHKKEKPSETITKYRRLCRFIT